MRKYIIIVISIIISLMSFTATAQMRADTEVCCFARIEFKQDKIYLFIPELSYNIKLLPKPQRNLMVSSSLRGAFCHTNEDFTAEIQRIKQIVLHSDISNQNQSQQEVYLKQLLLAMIYPVFFEIESIVIEEKLEILEDRLFKEYQQYYDDLVSINENLKQIL